MELITNNFYIQCEGLRPQTEFNFNRNISTSVDYLY